MVDSEPRDEAPEPVGALPVAPSLMPALATVRTPREERPVNRRLVTVTALATLLGVVGGAVAKGLLLLIALITNGVFWARVSTAPVAPTVAGLGGWVILAPVVGAVLIGFMARYGSRAICGHGIPEVMEKVLYGQSRIPARLLLLKPLSAAIAIGTGGPFGAEGPIIATGGAIGSLFGQLLRITADERKTLLAAGAAAGMAATFGTPVSAVLLSIELLLFEYRARSIVPVAFAASSATAMRLLLIGGAPAFAMPSVTEPTWMALAAYVAIGAVIGAAAAAISRLVYAVEDLFQRLPVPWMWWPALGALMVGVVGWVDPRILGVGYEHIEHILSGQLLGWSLGALVALKLLAWSVYLGSGTSGGTLAPLFIIGGGLGALLGSALSTAAPGLGVSPSVAGLVGMAATFAGASHALLASIVFAFEATRQPLSLLPLLAGCSASYLVALLLTPTSIMTERLARRGARISPEYAMDFLGQLLVQEVMSRDVVTVVASRSQAEARAWLSSPDQGPRHQGFPVVELDGTVVGVLTRRDLLPCQAGDGSTPVRALLHRQLAVAYPDNTLREAADHMVRERVGRLPVVSRSTGRLLGILSRSDLLAAHERRLHAAEGDATR